MYIERCKEVERAKERERGEWYRGREMGYAKGIVHLGPWGILIGKRSREQRKMYSMWEANIRVLGLSDQI